MARMITIPHSAVSARSLSAALLALLSIGVPGIVFAQSTAGPSFAAPSGVDMATHPSSPWPQPNAMTPVSSEASASLPQTGEELPSPMAGEEPALSGRGDWLLSDDEVVDESTWYETGRWFGPTPWDAGIELGLNGSTGTNDSFSLRTGGYVKRESRFSNLDFSLYHNRTTSGGLTTQNNATMDIRNDWLLDENSPWTLFTKANVFYDQFQTFDVHMHANSGIGYRILKQKGLSLMGRVGAGAKREFGGPDENWVPEALFGFEYEQKISGMQKLYCKHEYFPEFEEFGQYRMVTDAGWEIALVQPSNVSLKLSATDRYDSTPDGADPHLVNYSVLLMIKL